MLVIDWCLVVCCVFFFKQKTAYEVRISDWSSDVCSSDLASSTASRYGPNKCTPTCLALTSARPAACCGPPSNTLSKPTSSKPDSTLGASQDFGVSQRRSCSLVAVPRLSILTTNTNSKIGRAAGRERVCPYG